MPAQYGWYLIQRSGLRLALAGSILTIATLWLLVPAAAQFGIGSAVEMGMGMGMGMLSPPVQQNASRPSSGSSAEHRSNRTRSARRTSSASERHEARTKVPAKSDSNSSGAF